MDLSSDLISKFVKITNDEKTTEQTTNTYGTIVKDDNSTSVRLDGSDLLTPVSTTTNVVDGERVTVTIENHTAIVTGNISSPAARMGDIQDNIDAITELEILVAEKVSTKEFDAEKGRIDELVADNVKIKERLTADEAVISDLEADNATINEKLTANEADIAYLKTNMLTATDIEATYATIENLEATNAEVYNLEATYGEFADLTTERLEAAEAGIDDLYATKLDANNARITYAKITDLEAAKGDIDVLESNVADIDTLIFGTASGNTIQSSFANAVIAQLGDAQIKSAMIENVSASKITTGDIITNNVRVLSEDGSLVISDETLQISDGSQVRVQIGKDASNDYSINIWDAEGKLMFSKGGITDSAIKDAIIRNDMVSDTANIAAHKLDIDSLFEEINGSSNTIKSTKVYLDDKKQTLDVAFNSLSSTVTEQGETISSQGTAISAIQGQIASKIWQQDIDTASDSMSTQYSTLSQDLDSVSATVANHTTQISSKADNSVVTTVSNKVSSLETSLSGFQSSASETYATKTDLALTDNKANNAQASADSAQESVNNIDVGGRNLILNSSFDTDSSKWSYNTINPFEYVSDGGYDGGGAIELTVTGQSTVVPRQATSFTFSAGTSLTCSVKVKEIDGIWGTASYARWANLYSIPYAYHKELNDGWLLYVYKTKLVNELVTTSSAVFGFAGMGNGTFVIDDIKLERGNQATDWTAAPEDINAAMTTLKNRISTAETNISQNTTAITLTATKTEVESAKSEAISTASSDATAKANNALSNANTNTSNLLKNYSTTEEMNAAIKVQADSITSSVNSTYATKTALSTTNTNVTKAQTTANEAKENAAAAQDAVDTLEIGGRNLLRNSSFADGTSKWSCTSNSMSIVNGYSGNGLQLVITASTTVTPRQGINMTLKKGETLTGSAKVKIVEGDFSDYCMRFAGLFSLPLVETKPINDEWSLYIYRATATSDIAFTTSAAFGFAYGSTPGTYIVDDIKLEKGDKATDWTPAPEDIDDEITNLDSRVTSAETSITQLSDRITANVSETTNLGTRMSTVEQTASGLTTRLNTVETHASSAEKTATNYLGFSSSGLVVGDMTTSTLGKNVLIDSDSVDIRNGSTVMASFGADTITLGRNSEDSVIDLCDGAGRISANTAEAATSFPNRNAILIDSQEIETESVRFVANVSNAYGSTSTPSVTREAELYMLRSSGTNESCARLKSEHKTTSSGAYTNAGISAMTYDSASTTRAMVYASDSANSNYNQVNVYPTKTTMNKNLVLNGTTFTGKNKVLWSGGYYMSDTQTATLSEAISAQANGIVLVWSEYTDGASSNANFNMFFVPKHFITLHAGKGMPNFLGNGSGNIVCMKYLYISDTSIKGYSGNDDAATEKNCGITMTSNRFVLRYVIGV